MAQFFGRFHDQDGVLGRQRDQQHQPDLNVDVVGQSGGGQRQRGTHQRQGHGHQHRHRQRPRFVLTGQHQIHQQQRQAEHQSERATDQPLLVRKPGPLVTHARRQHLGGQFFHRIERLARAETGGRSADDRGGGHQVVLSRDRRAGGVGNVDEAADGHHHVGAAEHRDVAHFQDIGAVLRVGLHIDGEGLAVQRKQVDVGGAQVALDRAVGVSHRHAHAFGACAVEPDLDLRHAGSQRGEGVVDARIGLGGLDHEVSRLAELLEVATAVDQLELHLKAARNPEPVDGRRNQHATARLGPLRHHLGQLGLDAGQVFSFATVFPVLEHHVDQTAVGQGGIARQHRVAVER